MRHWRWLATWVVLAFFLAACSAEEPAPAAAEPGGPALIMFYTDN